MNTRTSETLYKEVDENAKTKNEDNWRRGTIVPERERGTEAEDQVK